MSLSKHTSNRNDQLYPPHGKINVTILASEWGSSKGGLSTLNRELAIQLAKFPEVKISFFVPKCSEQDKIAALSHNIKIFQATRRPGYDELEWLSFPPDQLHIDVIVGHGVKFGHQAQVIRESHKCKWIQVVHTDSEELGMFKTYQNPISTGEKKRKTEIELCEMADLVVGVGPKLCEAFRRYLRWCKKDKSILDITPGVFDEFVTIEHGDEDVKRCGILVFGRGDVEDFELKGFDIAGKAVAEVEEARLIFVGAPEGKHEDIAELFLKCGVPTDRLTIRSFLENRESLKRLFCEVDLVLMPSRTEGFGLTGLEALSAGLPVLVSKNSGFGEALSKVPFGESCVIDSEDSKVWADEIKKVWRKNRKERLQEAELLRSSYGEKYSWVTQSKDLVNKMIDIFHDASVCEVSAVQHQHQSSGFSLSEVTQKDGDQHAATSVINDQQQLNPKQRTHEKIELLDLQKTAAAKGFIICDNPASGNCMFYALSQQLKHVKGKNISHEQIRGKSVRFLENFPNLPNGTKLFDFVHGYLSWSDYLGSMKKDGTWGDHVILYAAANVYKTCIRVISSRGCDVVISPRYSGAIKTNPLMVGHIHDRHYVSLRPKQDASVCELRVAQHQQESSEVSLSKLAQEVKPADFDKHAVESIIHYLQQLKTIQQKQEESEPSEDLQKTFADKGFVICNDSASGNCMFYALSQQLQKVKGINISHREIRGDLVQFLENFPNLPDDTQLLDFVDGYSSWSDYLTSMEKDGTWGDHVILYAAANFYKTCIRVISSPRYDVMITPDYPSIVKTFPLVVGHILEKHFVSLQLKRDVVKTIERIRQLYKIREERLLPVPWCVDFSFSLNDIFTRLRIVAKDKTRGEMKDDITDMTAIFKTHRKCEKPRTVLIEGDPGMGKTTYSQKLAYDWATSREHWDKSFPMIAVLLLLRCHDIKSDFWEAIDEQLLPDDIDEKCKESFFNFIRENQSWTLFVFDGLDEADHGKIGMFINLAQSTKLPECLFVFTSRHKSGMKMRRYCDILWEIVGFTEEDAENFIYKYFKNKEHLTNRLLQQIRTRSDLSQLTSNPLNTALLCILCEDFKEAFPESRTQLYIEIVRCVLRRYEEKKGFSSDNEDLIEVYEDKLRSLGRIALQSLLKGELYIEESKVNSNDFKAVEKLGFLSVQSGGSKRKPCFRYGFLHKSFQEFFAGFHLALKNLRQEDELEITNTNQRFQGELRQVFLHMCGVVVVQCEETAERLLRNVTDHVNVLGANSKCEEVRGNLELVFSLLEECGKCKESLQSRLLYVFGTNLHLKACTLEMIPRSDLFLRSLSFNTVLTDLDLSFKSSSGESGRIVESEVGLVSLALFVNTTLAQLDLQGNDIGPSAATSLSQALSLNTTLTRLDLDCNNISYSGAASLSKALSANTSLTQLDLRSNNIGDLGAASLSQALSVNTTLTQLDLGGNNIGDSGAASLSQALSVNTTLTRLDLGGNKIGDSGAASLFQALSVNTALTHLYFGGNKIGDSGAASLSQALSVNTNLNHEAGSLCLCVLY